MSKTGELSDQARNELAQLAITLANDPKVGKDVKRRISELDPTKRFVDVDTDDLRSSVRKEFEDRDLADKQRRSNERLSAQRENLISSGKFTEDEVKDMEKTVMETHGIADYDVASKVFSADRRPHNPTPEIRTRSWTLPSFNKEDIHNMGTNSLNEAYRAIDDIKKNKRA